MLHQTLGCSISNKLEELLALFHNIKTLNDRIPSRMFLTCWTSLEYRNLAVLSLAQDSDLETLAYLTKNRGDQAVRDACDDIAPRASP